jgi:hypothetical protein
VGKIYDDRGHRMSPSHSRKKGVRYRYYLSLPLLDGRPEEAGSISRVSAAEIEHVVADAVRQELGIDLELAACDVIEGHVNRVEVHTAKISVEFREGGAEPKTIQIPWRKPPFKRRRVRAGIRESPGPASDPRRRTRPSHCCPVVRPAMARRDAQRERQEHRGDRQPRRLRHVQGQHGANIGAPRDRQGRDRWTATSRRRDFPPYRPSGVLARTVQTAWNRYTRGSGLTPLSQEPQQNSARVQVESSCAHQVMQRYQLVIRKLLQ